MNPYTDKLMRYGVDTLAWAPGSFVINGAVYFLAGQDRPADAILNDVWAYQLSAPSSTNELVSSKEVQIYPNPTTGILHFKNQLEPNSIISIQTISGQLVFQTTLGAQDKTINLTDLETGIYTVSIESEISITQEKLVVL